MAHQNDLHFGNDAQYAIVQAAFSAGTFREADQITLSKYIGTIAMNATGDDAIQSRDIVQALTLNHLSLQRHIDKLEARNKSTQRWVVALAMASLFGTAAQAWFAFKAEDRAELESRSKGALITKPVGN